MLFGILDERKNYIGEGSLNDLGPVNRKVFSFFLKVLVFCALLDLS